MFRKVVVLSLLLPCTQAQTLLNLRGGIDKGVKNEIQTGVDAACFGLHDVENCQNSDSCLWCQDVKFKNFDVCVSQRESTYLPISLFSCSDNTKEVPVSAQEKFEEIDTHCLRYKERSGCRSTDGCVWCEDETFNKFNLCVSQTESTLLPSNMYNCVNVEGEKSDKNIGLVLECAGKSTKHNCINAQDKTGSDCLWCEDKSEREIEICVTEKASSYLSPDVWTCTSSKVAGEGLCKEHIDENSCSEAKDCMWCVQEESLNAVNVCTSPSKAQQFNPAVWKCSSKTDAKEFKEDDLCYQGKTETECTSSVDAEGNACTWCVDETWDDEMCVSSSTAKDMQSDVWQCGSTKKQLNEDSCIDKTSEADCSGSQDAVGNPCSWCVEGTSSKGVCVTPISAGELNPDKWTCSGKDVDLCIDQKSESDCNNFEDVEGNECVWCVEESQSDGKISICVPSVAAAEFDSDIWTCSSKKYHLTEMCASMNDEDDCMSADDEQGNPCSWCTEQDRDEYVCVSPVTAESFDPEYWNCTGSDVDYCVDQFSKSNCSKSKDVYGDDCVWCKDDTWNDTMCTTDEMAKEMNKDIWDCEDLRKIKEEDNSDICYQYQSESDCKSSVDAEGDVCSWCVDETWDDEMCVSSSTAQDMTSDLWQCSSLMHFKDEDVCYQYESESDCKGSVDAEGDACSWCVDETFDDDMCVSSKTAQDISNLWQCSSLKHFKDEDVCYEYQSESDCTSSVDDEGDNCFWCVDETFNDEMCVSSKTAKDMQSDLWQCSSTSSSAFFSSSFASEKLYSVQDSLVDPKFCDPESPKSLSGYFGVTGSKYDSKGQDKNLFYWFFEKRDSSKEEASETPIIVWLTGGPGCSSVLALLLENGPCSVNEDGTGTSLNEYSWNKAAHMLWLDQPAGVGYSYGRSTDSNEDMVGEDSYYFLQSFFQAHPEYAQNPLFIVGESYGGHYAPSIAHRIFVGNNEAKEGTINLNLAGLAVGNGLTHPSVQYKYYAQMAYDNSHGIKTVSEDVYEAMQKATPHCVDSIEKCNKAEWSISRNLFCRLSVTYCNLSLVEPFSATGLNVYDIREKCENPPLCYDMSNIDKFLNLPTTKTSLHVSSHVKLWQACNMGINMKFMVDWMEDYSSYVADLLNAGIPALIYAGDVDFICNYLGNQAWTLDLDWDFKQEFNDANDHDWKGKGLARTSNGFTFLQVFDAGHMVPKDQPQVALDMIQSFINGDEF